MLNNIRATQTLLISLSVKGGGSAPKDLQAKPPTTGIGSLLTIGRVIKWAMWRRGTSGFFGAVANFN